MEFPGFPDFELCKGQANSQSQAGREESLRPAKPAEVCCEIFGKIWFGIRFKVRNLRWEKPGEIKLFVASEKGT